MTMQAMPEVHGELQEEKDVESGANANAMDTTPSNAKSDAPTHHYHHDHNASSEKKQENSTHQGREMSVHEHHHDMNAERPMFATVNVGVCHCGAGCLRRHCRRVVSLRDWGADSGTHDLG